MELCEIYLPSNKKLEVEIDRKKMKTFRLKVYPDCSVRISVPMNTPMETINKFLSEKSGWVETKISRFEKTVGYAATNEIRNGSSIKMYGDDLIFSIAQSGKNAINHEGKVIQITVVDINNDELIMKLFEKWWRQAALETLEDYIKKLYPIVKKYDIPFPKVAVRRMKTLWGSCSINRKIITFNLYLIKAKPACIEYVVLHELVHFLYPNHSRSFYDFLGSYMPDWKERKKILDLDVVHGL